MNETIKPDLSLQNLLHALSAQEEGVQEQAPEPKMEQPAEEAEAEAATNTPPPYQTIIDVYVVTHEADEQAETVEGSLSGAPAATPASERQSEPAGADATVSPSQARSWLVPGRRPHPLVVAVLLVVVLGLLAGGLLVFWQAGPSVTITLLPRARQVSTHTTISVVTAHAAHLLPQQVPGRHLPTLTLSQQTSAPTTGARWQVAQVGRGRITFYNAAPYVQAIAAGTLLVGNDGVQVVTEADAFLPAAVPPSEGQVSVWAHAVLPGPSGNIAAADIYGACCRQNVFAQNSAFTGGQDARLLRVVSAGDWQRALSSLQTSLRASVQAAFAAQVQPEETLIAPLACAPTVSASQQVGQEASLLQMTLDEQCHGAVYQTQAGTALAQRALAAAASVQIGEQNYRRVGDLHVQISKSTPEPGGSLSLTLQVSGTWLYQFSAQQEQQLAHLIAGKSAQQARTLLLQQGVAQVETSVGSGTLPADPGHIHLLILQAGS